MGVSQKGDPITIGFPTKNDQHLGWRLGVPPFKETAIRWICFFGGSEKVTRVGPKKVMVE